MSAPLLNRLRAQKWIVGDHRHTKSAGQLRHQSADVAHPDQAQCAPMQLKAHAFGAGEMLTPTQTPVGLCQALGQTQRHP